MPKQSSRESVVKQGGIAREPSSADDVTRDTYGDAKAAPVSRDKEKRAAAANRAAAAAGIPGVALPETESQASSVDAQHERAQSTDESGDRIASRQDMERLRPKR
jgi:hypothetical protein